MDNNNIKIDDVAEVLAYIISQEKVMAVPPVLIPTEGTSVTRKQPKKEPRNKYYNKKDPHTALSISKMEDESDFLEDFPIENDQCEIEVII